MDGSSRKDRQVLKRIVALLFALATLADRAGRKPRPIRIAVLWLLRAAEWVAWDFVIALAQETGVDPDLAAPLHGHDIADEAGRLAQSFTVLAELLSDITDRSPSTLPSGRISGAIAHLMWTFRTLVPAPGMQEQLFPDTS